MSQSLTDQKVLLFLVLSVCSLGLGRWSVKTVCSDCIVNEVVSSRDCPDGAALTPYCFFFMVSTVFHEMELINGPQANKPTAGESFAVTLFLSRFFPPYNLTYKYLSAINQSLQVVILTGEAELLTEWKFLSIRLNKGCISFAVSVDSRLKW